MAAFPITPTISGFLYSHKFLKSFNFIPKPALNNKMASMIAGREQLTLCSKTTSEPNE
jgi:hypothetical protein